MELCTKEIKVRKFREAKSPLFSAPLWLKTVNVYIVVFIMTFSYHPSTFNSDKLLDSLPVKKLLLCAFKRPVNIIHVTITDLDLFGAMMFELVCFYFFTGLKIDLF
ncbi:MAG: hypothetical protein K0S32_3747 [Bacteroidetes bacterium]|nr:hypothetical protein [Bacteroidota bacterium]